MAASKTMLVYAELNHRRLIGGKWQEFTPRDAPYRVPVADGEAMIGCGAARSAEPPPAPSE